MEEFFVPNALIKINPEYASEFGHVGTLNASPKTVSKLRDKHNLPSYLKYNTNIGNFTSVGNFLKFIALKMKEPKKSSFNSSVSTKSKDWCAFEYDKALKVFTNTPWEVVNFKSKELVLENSSESGRDVQFDVTGEFFDVGRYLDNVPEVFGVSFNGKNRGKFANITIAGDYACGVKQNVIEVMQKRIVRLVDWLEFNNIRTKVTVVFSSDNSHLQIALKDYNEPLDITSIAVATHDSFFRRLVFRFIEHSDTISWGYGSSVAFSRWLSDSNAKKDSKADRNSVDIYIEQKSYIDSVVKSFDEAEVTLAKKIELDEYVTVEI